MPFLPSLIILTALTGSSAAFAAAFSFDRAAEAEDVAEVQGLTAQDTNNIHFTYEAASLAYAGGQAPTKEGLTGNWLVTGTAYSEGAQKKGFSGFYGTDGKFTFPGKAGYFISKLEFTPIVDAFKAETLTFMTQTLGFETGKEYERVGPTPVVFNSTEAEVYKKMIGVESCMTSAECRTIATTNQLLCQFRISETDQRCTHYGLGSVAVYSVAEKIK